MQQAARVLSAAYPVAAWLRTPLATESDNVDPSEPVSSIACMIARAGFVESVAADSCEVPLDEEADSFGVYAAIN